MFYFIRCIYESLFYLDYYEYYSILFSENRINFTLFRS
jgi:hypothetical protein